jgi:hypothetical protein
MTNSTDSIGSAPVDSARGKLIGSGELWGELKYPPKAVSSMSTKSAWSFCHSRGIENRAVYDRGCERIEVGFGGAGRGLFPGRIGNSNHPCDHPCGASLPTTASLR